MATEDKFNELKKKLGIDQSGFLSKLDVSLDRISSRMDNSRRISSYNNLLDLLRTASGGDHTTTSGASSQMEDLLTSALAQGGVSAYDDGRRARYENYESIENKIPQCAQAIRVYADNILSPDSLTKNTLLSDYDTTSADAKKAARKVNIITNFLNLENYVDIIVNKTLVLGDHYILISDTDKEIKKALQKPLRESSKIKLRIRNNNNYTESEEPVKIEVNLTSYPEELKHLYETLNEYSLSTPSTLEKQTNPELLTKMTVPSIKDYVKDSDKKDKKLDNVLNLTDEESLKSKLKDIQVEHADAKNIVKLQMGSTVLGYLKFEDVSTQINMYSKMSATTVLSNKANYDRMMTDIMLKISSVIPLNKINKQILDKDTNLKNIVFNLLKSAGKDGEIKVNIEFISPERIQHFKLDSSKFYPYGESIFEPVAFTAKLVMMMKIAIVIYRLARAPEKRSIYVDTGASRDVANIIEQVKHEIKRKEVTLESIGGVDTIPRFISMFEDYFLPTKDGKRFVEFDIQEAGQLASKIDELDFLTKELISGLGIPPALVGYEQDVTAKNVLSQENVKFARTIIRLQKMFSRDFTELLFKLQTMIGIPEQTAALVKILLPPPRALQNEKDAELADTAARIINTLQQLGLSRKLALKKYLFFLDLDEWEKEETSEKIENIGQEAPPQDQSQMMPPGSGY